MGTRSTYRIIEKNEDTQEQLALVYVQYDGYPSGHPCEIAEWLSQASNVNGFNSETPSRAFNGAGCFAARMVGHLKADKIGNVYLHPFSARGNSGEDYMYDIIFDEIEESIKMIAYDYNENIIFDGSPAEFVSKYSKATV
jgi:hypothetical protein